MNKKFNSICNDEFFYPYCSATSFYRLSGAELDFSEKFGSDCVWQSARLKKRLTEAGVRCKYIDDVIVGRHRSLLCDMDGYLYYVSPYLMLDYPVFIGSHKDANATIATSYPYVGNSPSPVDISLEEGMLSVVKRWNVTGRVDSYRFDLNKTTNDELTSFEYIRRLIHPEQNNLSMRIIDKQEKEVLHYIVPLSNIACAFTLSSKGMARNGTTQYKVVLGRIASLLEATQDEIEDYVIGAVMIRSKWCEANKIGASRSKRYQVQVAYSGPTALDRSTADSDIHG